MESPLGMTATRNLLFAAVLCLGACTAQTSAAGTTSLAVEVAGPERISVRAERAPLDAVIAEVARQTGLEVTWLGPRGSEPVSARLERVDLAAALERILRGRNHSLFLADGRPARVVIGSLTASGQLRMPRAPAPEREAEQSFPYEEDLPAVAMDDEREARLDDELSDLRLVALEDEEASYRAEAVELLAEREDVAARDAVAAAIGDADAGVREVALGALAERSAAADPLVLAAVVESTAELGGAGLRLLRDRAVNDAAAEAALVQVANTDPDPATRAEAASVLDEIAALRRAA
jgi:hypothetical protein